GIMKGPERPDYARCVRIVTASAQKQMLAPGAIPIAFPIIIAFIFGISKGRVMLGGLLLGVIVSGLYVAISMTSGGGAWDNAKKLIEDGKYGGEGAGAHQTGGAGGTAGGPDNDTRRPPSQPLSQRADKLAR